LWTVVKLPWRHSGLKSAQIAGCEDKKRLEIIVSIYLLNKFIATLSLLVCLRRHAVLLPWLNMLPLLLFAGLTTTLMLVITHLAHADKVQEAANSFFPKRYLVSLKQDGSFALNSLFILSKQLSK
jgi:hypothetical protein